MHSQVQSVEGESPSQQPSPEKKTVRVRNAQGGWTPLGSPQEAQRWLPHSSFQTSGHGSSRARVAPYSPESATLTFKLDESLGRESESPAGRGEGIAPDGRRVHDYGGGDVYDGEWAQGKRHGQGKMVWNSGQEYEGEWHLDSMHGEGVYRWPDGQIYEGQFKNGSREGLGTLKLGDGQTKYVGSFVGILSSPHLTSPLRLASPPPRSLTGLCQPGLPLPAKAARSCTRRV